MNRTAILALTTMLALAVPAPAATHVLHARKGSATRHGSDTPNKAAVQRLLKAFGRSPASNRYKAEVEDELLLLSSRQPMECNSIQPTTHLVGDTSGRPVLMYESEGDDHISLAREGDDLVISREPKGGKEIVSRMPVFKKGVKEKARVYDLHYEVLVPAKAEDVVADTAKDAAYLGAALSGNVEGMRKALESGASATATVNGLSALQLACLKGHVAAVRFLLKNGADAKDGGVHELSPLVMAATGELCWEPRKAERLPMLRLLLDAGADVNAAGPDGGTALYYLARDPKCVKELLAHGADPNAKDEVGNTPLFAVLGRPLEGESFPQESLDLLLKAGADAGVINKFGGTVLLEAMLHELPVAVIRRLLEAGADKVIDRYAYNEWTLLIQASQSRNVELVELFLDYGADPNMQGKKRGETALQFVNGKDACKIARMLLEHGAKVDLADKRGITPLMNAAYCDRIELVRFLLDAGANPNLRDNDGETALDMSKNNPQVRKLLREHMKK